MRKRRELRVYRAFVAGLLSLLLLTACLGGRSDPAASGGTTPGMTPPDGMTSPDYGMSVFLWGAPGSTERDLKLTKDAGFRWVKQLFQWNYIEGKGKGQYEWNEPDRIVAAIESAGLKILARVDVAPMWARPPGARADLHGPPANYQDYFDFVGALAARYKGRIQAYQIWNEPNLAREWDGVPPSPVDYMRLLKGAYMAIKAADPQAIVISAGLSPTTAPLPDAIPDVEFLRGMYLNGLKEYSDMIGVHGAGFKAPPEADPGEVAKNPALTNNDPSPEELKRVYAFRHIEDLRKVMVANGDAAKRVAVLEFGWTTDNRPDSPYAWHAVTEEQKAQYLAGAYTYAAKNWRPWIAVMVNIYIAAPYWTQKDEQWYWSITDEKGNPRPSYEALKRLEKVR